jgi:hypothetical protein
MKAAVFILLFSVAATAFAETPKEVAKRIIASEAVGAYNPLNNTAEEMTRASAINSQLQLQQLMLGDTVSEELRICYALRVIRERHKLFREINGTQTHSTAEQKLEADEAVLAAHLLQLNQPKK